MALADRYGLLVSTSSVVAMERYQDGMDNLLAYGLDGERSFAEANAWSAPRPYESSRSMPSW